MYRASFVEQVQGHQCISTRPLPPLSKNFRNLPLVGHANRPHMRRGHGGAYLSYGKRRQTYRGEPCRISGSGDRRKGARGRIPRGHSCAFCVSSLYLTSPKTIEMTDWAPVWEMYMEFSIYRLDYISSVYIHTHVGLVSAVPGVQAIIAFMGSSLKGEVELEKPYAAFVKSVPHLLFSRSGAVIRVSQ